MLRERKLNYDMHHSPSSITSSIDGLPLSRQIRSRSATNPPQPFIQIEHPSLVDPIIVFPSTPHTSVTVDDVFLALYRYFSACASFREFDVLPYDAQLRVNDTFQRRVGAQESERFRGVKRVDFLMGRSRFLGLSAKGNDPRIFALNVF
jgi:hypothetical protein